MCPVMPRRREVEPWAVIPALPLLLVWAPLLALPGAWALVAKPLLELSGEALPKSAVDFTELILRGEPFVLRGAFKSWIEDRETLRRFYGHRHIPSCITRNHLCAPGGSNTLRDPQGKKHALQSDALFRFDSYFEKPQENGTAWRRMAVETQLWDAKFVDGLMGSLPRWFHGPVLFENPTIFASANGSDITTCLHFDDSDNMFVQLHGRKMLAMYPFMETDRLEPLGQLPCKSARCGHVSRKFGLTHEQLYEVFSKPELDAPVMADATRHEVLLDAGDMLHIPRKWWHEGLNGFGLSVGLAGWFKAPNPFTMLYHSGLLYAFAPSLLMSDKFRHRPLPLPEGYVKLPWPRTRGRMLPGEQEVGMEKIDWVPLMHKARARLCECVKVEADASVLDHLASVLGQRSPVVRLYKKHLRFLLRRASGNLCARTHKEALREEDHYSKRPAIRFKGLVRALAKEARSKYTKPLRMDYWARHFDLLYPGCRKRQDCDKLHTRVVAILGKAVRAVPCEAGDDVAGAAEDDDEDWSWLEEEAEEERGVDADGLESAPSDEDLRQGRVPKRKGDRGDRVEREEHEDWGESDTPRGEGRGAQLARPRRGDDQEQEL